jgi:hypothetical protein
LAVLGDELIVAMTGKPGFLAGYPIGFSTSMAPPNWFLRGGIARNKLNAPLSVAVDNGTGTGTGFILVGNGPADGSQNSTIVGYRRDDIARGISGTTLASDEVTPFMTIATTFPPVALAVDPESHTLYAADPGGNSRILLYPSNGTGEVSSVGVLQVQQTDGPMGLAFLPSPGGGTLYVVDNFNGGVHSVPGGSTGLVDPVINFAVESLKVNAAGLTICN